MEPMARRVFMAELKADGLFVGRKRIARLMRAAGIAGVSRRRSAPVTTRQARDHHLASDLVRRNFMAERPNELLNCGNLRRRCQAKGPSPKGEADSSEAPSRDGAVRSSVETAAMAEERRDGVIWRVAGPTEER